MLSKRILTALLLIPPLLAALIYLPTVWVALLFAVFIAMAAWEWSTLAGIRRGVTRLLYVLSILVLGGISLLALNRDVFSVTPLLGAAVLWWFWMLAELLFHPQPTTGWLASRTARIACGYGVLVPAWVAMLFLHAADPDAPSLLLYLLVLVWTADTAAYFFGWSFGHRKLARHISPGKTLEGALGALGTVVLLAYVAGTHIWKHTGTMLALWVGLGLVTASASIVGDLAESKLKRVAGVKDSGNLLPGHGGVLDRIDALTAAAPIFAAGWIFLLSIPAP